MIHNQVAFDRAQAKKQNAFDKKVSVALFHLEGVLNKSDGIIAGQSEDEVYALLIAGGVLGAMKSNRRIARAVKESWRLGGKPLSTDDSYRLRDATIVVKTAVAQAAENNVVEMDFQKGYVCLILTSYEYAFDYVDLGAYDHNHPLRYKLPGGAFAKLGDYINE